MKRSAIFITAAIILASIICSSAVEPEKKTFRVSGTVLSYNNNVLRIQEKIDIGILRLHSFKITKETKISGAIRESGWVAVTYFRKKFGKRWVKVAVDIVSLGIKSRGGEHDR
jgi:hypothetical protein